MPGAPRPTSLRRGSSVGFAAIAAGRQLAGRTCPGEHLPPQRLELLQQRVDRLIVLRRGAAAALHRPRHPGCARSGDRALLESHRVSVGRQRPLRVRPHSGHYSCDLMAHQQGARRGGRHLGQPHFTTAWTTRRPGETSSTQGGIGGAGGMGALLTARPFYWNSGNPRRAVHCWSGLGGKGPWPSNPQDVSRAWSGGGQWARAGRRPRWGTENCRWYRELSH